MIRRVTPALAAAFLFLAPVASHAALAAYTQNFETLTPSDPAALQNDGWLVYGNVFSPDHSTYYYGYGPYPAPTTTGFFCAIDVGQGGTEQGLQQLSVYSDYNNVGAHSAGDLVESNVYREQTIGAADVNTQWTFQFDAKLGNLVAPSTALAFIKTLDPNNGYQMSNFLTVDMTAIPATWGTYTISLVITPALAGQLFQIGFASTTTNYIAAGVYYDNIYLFKSGTLGVDGKHPSRTIELRAAAPNPFTRATRIEYALAQRGAADLAIYDIVGRRVATLFNGTAEAGPHTATWDGRAADGHLAPTGVYQYVLQTAAGRESRSLVLSR